MRVAEELRKHADLAIKEGGMYYSGEYLDAIARRAESEQAENAKLIDVLHEVETEAVHAFQCLQQECERLAAENAKLRELCATDKRETCRRVPYDPSLSPFEMYVCDYCGHAIDAPDRFCGGCGRQVEREAEHEQD